MELRDNQIDPVRIGVEVLTSKKPRKEVLVLPTAHGKSLVISEIVNRLPLDGNILVVNPSKELLEQGLSKASFYNFNPSVWSASLKRKEFGRVIYSTMASLNDDFFQNAGIKYVLVDEADYGTKSGTVLSKLLKKYKIDNLLGLTATPIYMDNGLEGSTIKMMTRVRGKLFNTIAHVVQMKDMGEYWSKLEFPEVRQISDKALELNSSGSEFKEEVVVNAFKEEKIEEEIVSCIERTPKNKSILIFVPSISIAEEIGGNIGAVVIHSKLDAKTRDERVSGFKSGKYRICINCSLLSVGFDFPQLSCIIDSNPTNSVRNHIQKLGRGVRIAEGKDKCIVWDIAGNKNRFGNLEDITFEDIEGFGWGMFTGDELLSGIPMALKLRPKKHELVGKKVVEVKIPENINNFEITFGKYKGLTIGEVVKEDLGYLKWLKKAKEDNNQVDNVYKILQQIIK